MRHDVIFNPLLAPFDLSLKVLWVQVWLVHIPPTGKVFWVGEWLWSRVCPSWVSFQMIRLIVKEADSMGDRLDLFNILLGTNYR